MKWVFTIASRVYLCVYILSNNNSRCHIRHLRPVRYGYLPEANFGACVCTGALALQPVYESDAQLSSHMSLSAPMAEHGSLHSSQMHCITPGYPLQVCYFQEE